MPAPTLAQPRLGQPDFAPQQPTIGDAFPITPLLDDLNRADGPIGASWISNAFGSVAGFNISSNQAVANSATDSGMVWNGNTFGPDCEFYFDIPVYATAIIFLAVRASGLTSTWSGYQLQVDPTLGWRLFRSDLGVGNLLGTAIRQPVSSGDSVGLRARGSELSMWYRSSGGAWVKVGTRIDATYNNAGRVGLEAINTTQRFDNFGGGDLSPLEFFTPARPNPLTDPIMPPSGLTLYPSQQPYYPPSLGTGFDAVTPGAITATSDVTASVVRLAAISPAGITSTSAMSASVVRLRPVTPSAITASSTVAASVARLRPVTPAGITASSAITSSVVRRRPVAPAAITASSTVSAAVVRLRPITPAAITASSSLTATVTKTSAGTKAIVPGALTSTSTITASVVHLIHLTPVAISATSLVEATVQVLAAIPPAPPVVSAPLLNPRRLARDARYIG